ncbi:hypothetical protein CBER1_02670 [Cercospora berteroae]|uniref:DNA replication regulator Sld3 C-terminal domain-containing protein n=1 Tax=Cercospora berteroae TaxID=357750 RepID=A0A2S6CJX1_9PEZI|nr:hypothetical protein CBER1_02670 [Cercospora berteroae]
MSVSHDAAFPVTTTAIPIITPQKRRRDELDDSRIAIDRRPIIVHACTADAPTPPLVLTPQCLLSRAQLPIAYLDPAQDSRRLFTAHVHLLETGQEFYDSTALLLVEDEADHSLYAIERVQTHKYALCRLTRSVALEELLALPPPETEAGAPAKKRCAPQSGVKDQPWWAMAAVGAPSCSTYASEQIPKLSMQPQGPSPLVREEVPLPVQESPARVEGPLPEVLQTASFEQTLEDLSKHYLDALYLSRTTLAYFVKGPLARARAALSSQPATLIAFLRGAMLNPTSMDKKFRDVLAGIVKDISVLDTPATLSKSRRKKKWRSKRDKHGLFVDEKEYIEGWWRKHDEDMHTPLTNETNEALLKRRLQVVRNRETLLQVVVAMEVLALEQVAAACSENPPAALRSEDPPGDNGDTGSKDKKQRRKKEIDAHASLETLVERLNIFHTVEASPVKTKDGESCSANADTKDELKTFAAEVIIPFFASRIFDVANSVSKKLGGPSASRPREKSSVKAPRKPGEPTVRQPPEKKPRKPLGRTSTDTLNHVGRQPPALMRSSTDKDALAPLIKRERSETPSLHDIAAAKTAATVSRKKPTGLDHYTVKHRQIDLSAMSQANRAKIRKNKNLEEKILKDALNGIRKPNRALATEETARNADESFARALARSKPPKSQTQRSTLAKESTRIIATPRHVKATPAGRRQSQNMLEVRSGSTTAVPSSAIGNANDAYVPSSTFAVPHTGHRERHKDVTETPSRGFARFMPSGLARAPGTLIESPTLSRSASILATPLRPLRMPALAETPLAEQATELARLGTTSHTSLALSDQHDDSGIGLESPGMRNKPSIYDALGWNEDYDEGA